MKGLCLLLRVLVLALFAATAVGCGESEPRESDRYYDDTYDFSMKFPDNWEQIKNMINTPQAKSPITARSPVEGGL